MIKINLIPLEYVEKLDKKAMLAKAILIGVFSVAVVFVISGWYFNKAMALEAQAVDLQKQCDALQDDVKRAEKINADITEVNKYLNSINSITRGRMVYSHFMQDLLINLPGTIWFGSIATSSKGETIGVSLPVSSKSIYDLAYWISALETDPRYSEVTLGGISVSEDASGKTMTTTVSMKYNRK